jgi:hypothetical protein
MLRALWVLISGLRLWWDYRRLRRLGLSDEAIKALIRRRLPEEFPDTSQADVEMALRIFRGK